MRALGAVVRIPGFALPVFYAVRRVLIKTLPPDVAVGSLDNVREDGIAAGRGKRVGV